MVTLEPSVVIHEPGDELRVKTVSQAPPTAISLYEVSYE